MKKKVKLFPVIFNEKKYYKKDCSDIYLCFYFELEDILYNAGVYATEGLIVFPDGSTEQQ